LGTIVQKDRRGHDFFPLQINAKVGFFDVNCGIYMMIAC
jgi:hypothetical protein